MYLERKIRVASIFESKRKGKAVAGNTHRRYSKVGYREIEMLQVVLYLVSRKRIRPAN